ncbi:MAG: hypothetical protein ACK4HV_01290 [Parachlamydiaceae bacterium]
MNLPPASRESGSISVYDNGSLIYSNSLSFEDLKKRVNEWDKEPRPVSLLRGCFIPSHSKSRKQLVKNIFAPALLNRALEIQSVALKILSIPFAFFLDAITLLPRLIVAPFKLDPEFESPIFSFISRELGASSVKLRVQYEKTVIKSDDATCLKLDESREIALTPYASINGTIIYNNKEMTFHRVDGEWDMQSNYDLPPRFFSYKA